MSQPWEQKDVWFCAVGTSGMGGHNEHCHLRSECVKVVTKSPDLLRYPHLYAEIHEVRETVFAPQLTKTKSNSGGIWRRLHLLTE